MCCAHLSVIDLFSAPACVIRQYAVNIWYVVEIPLTIGKRPVPGQNRPYAEETPGKRAKCL
jgi:hypothetical protein